MRRERAPLAGRIPGAAGVALPVLALLALPCLSAMAAPDSATRVGLAGQEPSPPVEAPFGSADSLQLVDDVVAIVGDTVILRSEIEQELLRLQSRGVGVPEPGTPRYEQARREVLQGMVEQTILLYHAKRVPELAPGDARLEEEVERRFGEIRAQFDSDQALQAEVERAGMNMFQFRQMLRSQARAEMLLQNFRGWLAQNGELPPVAVSESEIQEYFDRFGTGETRPATVSFDRIVIDPEPDSADAASARERAERALEEIRAGTEFEVAARRYSDDEGTRAEGGDLGWLRREQVVPAFADVAWAAPPGRAVGPVRTRFGYHVIKVENTRASERKLRHILIEPEIDDADVERARERAAALADSLRDGADPGRLARRHDLREDEVRLDQVQMDQLLNRFGAEYARRLAQPETGEIVGPFEALGETGRAAFVVIRVRDFKPEGPYELEDVRQNIRRQLLQQKQFSRYLEDLRDATFVEIRL